MGEMRYNATADDGGGGWLGVSPTNGFIPAGGAATLTSLYATAALAPGDYGGRITVMGNEGGGVTGRVDVTMRVYATPVLMVNPMVVTQVVDRGGNPTSVFFSVRNGSGSPVVGMGHRESIVRNDGNMVQGVSPAEGVSTGDYCQVGIYFRNISDYASGSYTAEVRVAATNYGVGYAGYWSAETNVRVVVVISAPEAPGAVRATKGDYADRVGVSWDRAVSPAGGLVTYTLLRHTTFDSGYAQAIASGLSGTNYDDVSVSPGIRYYYWVVSVNAYGQAGAVSAYDTGYRRLSAPEGLFASDGEYTNRIAVS